MSTNYDSPSAAAARPTAPYPAWPGYGGSGTGGPPPGYGTGGPAPGYGGTGGPAPGYGGPAPLPLGYGGMGGLPPGYGGGPEGPGRGPVRRFRLRLLIAAVALAAGAATFLGLQPGSASTTAQIAARVSPGLVDVVSTLGYQQAQAAGTGMVLTSSGTVLTNNHVIQGATSIAVTDIGNGRTYQAKVEGYDRSHDIAVLQLGGASGLQTVDLGNSADAAVGQRVVALGNAGGKGGAPSVAEGHIVGLGASITASEQSSGTSEQLTGLIHHNADIQPGDSGGPLVNSAGEVIGVDTAASSGFRLESGQSQAQTQAFAIPVNEALSIARQIEAGTGSASVHIGATAFAGVQIMSAGNAVSNGVPDGSGAVVAGILPGSPAQAAGLAAGDVITAVGGQQVSSPEVLQAVLGQHRPGDSVTITWTGQSGPARASLTLTAGPAG
jgi:S1-C subfamily serine protease